MSWTVIVPLNQGRERKTRLANRMDVEAREQLAEAMAAHVLAVLASSEGVTRVVVLSPVAPKLACTEWRRDTGRGLNAELEGAVRTFSGNVAIVLGDLPLLSKEAVRALLDAASEHCVALAPDRAGVGTNALAMRGGMRLPLAFGPGSLAAHARLSPHVLVARAELALDVDDSDDLEAAKAAGWDCKK